jgi:membrane protease YdiL (CAAX protease family)
MVAEVFVVIALGVLPDLVNAVTSLFLPRQTSSYAFDALWMIAHTIQVSSVVFYLMWRSPEGFSGFGVRRFRLWRDGAMAAALAIILWGSNFVVYTLMWSMPGLVDLYHQTTPPDAAAYFATPRTPLDIASVVVMSFGTALSEELVIAAFLVTRLHALTRSGAASILIATTLFTSYHIYQGVWALPSIFVFGLINTAAFFWFRRLWPVVLAHALNDIAAFLLM